MTWTSSTNLRYLYQYTNEAAWKEDRRRLDTRRLADRMLGLALASPASRVWKDAGSGLLVGDTCESDLRASSFCHLVRRSQRLYILRECKCSNSALCGDAVS